MTKKLRIAGWVLFGVGAISMLVFGLPWSAEGNVLPWSAFIVAVCGMALSLISNILGTLLFMRHKKEKQDPERP